jgi:hypothetical protein
MKKEGQKLTGGGEFGGEAVGSIFLRWGRRWRFLAFYGGFRTMADMEGKRRSLRAHLMAWTWLGWCGAEPRWPRRRLQRRPEVVALERNAEVAV